MSSDDFLRELFGYQDQVVVVIGGAGVLGSALAEGFAAAGARVAIAGRSLDRAEESVERLTALHPECCFFAVNAAARESVVQLREQVLAVFGRVDVLVNCAGVNSAVPYFEIDDGDWQRVLDGILTATHLGCQIFGETMCRQPHGGAILNIGSVTAHLPLSRVFAYSAAKAAVVNLTQNLAREFAPHGVRVNALCPGFFPAEQNRKILDAQRVESILQQTPLRRFGEPHELVGAALLLCARRAGAFITGEDLYVDGGFTSMRF